MNYSNDNLYIVGYLPGQMPCAVFSQSTCEHSAVKADSVCVRFLETAPQAIILPFQSEDEAYRLKGSPVLNRDFTCLS